MRNEMILKGAVMLVFAAFITLTLAVPFPEEDDMLDELEDYGDNNMETFLEQAQEKRAPKSYTPRRRSSYIYVFRKSCIKRGGSCDHRYQDCCENATCRCNLFGSNCRCQRMGLFQKWGK